MRSIKYSRKEAVIAIIWNTQKTNLNCCLPSYVSICCNNVSEINEQVYFLTCAVREQHLCCYFPNGLMGNILIFLCVYLLFLGLIYTFEEDDSFLP